MSTAICNKKSPRIPSKITSPSVPICAELPYFLFLFEQSCLIYSVHAPALLDPADSVLHLEDGKITQSPEKPRCLWGQGRHSPLDGARGPHAARLRRPAPAGPHPPARTPARTQLGLWPTAPNRVGLWPTAPIPAAVPGESHASGLSHDGAGGGGEGGV